MADPQSSPPGGGGPAGALRDGAGPWLGWIAVALLLCLLSFARPVDHDESQYVAAAAAATALLASCDVFLFATGTARNDALPAAALAAALWLAIRAEQGRGDRIGAAAAGLLLAAATAAKVTYALPALAYGGWALLHRRHRPAWIAAGALPVTGFVLWSAAAAPLGFLFGVVTFPMAAPADFYAGRPWKLSGWAKLIDLAKFLALGPALLALLAGAGRRRPALLFWLTLAGLAAAAAPTPTWRQYLLPMLPPLFVLLAWTWARRPPTRAWRGAFALFAAVGLAPTAAALASARPAMAAAARDGVALRAAMDAAGVDGPVATLSPQFLPATGRLPDARFAAGPFWFRSRSLAGPPGLPLLARRDLPGASLPRAVLVGGEGAWTSGDDALDRLLAGEARRRGYHARPVAGTRFVLWTAP